MKPGYQIALYLAVIFLTSSAVFAVVQLFKPQAADVVTNVVTPITAKKEEFVLDVPYIVNDLECVSHGNSVSCKELHPIVPFHVPEPDEILEGHYDTQTEEFIPDRDANGKYIEKEHYYQ